MTQDVIALTGVTLQRGGRTLLDGIDWHVPAGSCCAVLGPNGAGKSTLLAVVGGYLWPQQGQVEVLGERYGRVDLSRLRRRMGMLSHSRVPDFHPDMTSLETVVAGRWGAIIIPPHVEVGEEDTAAAWRALRITGMESRAEEPFGNLSSGEQMRTLLARALVAGPELLILDEPTSALDMAGRASFRLALDRLLEARPQLAVVLVTHAVEDLPRHTREVLLLREGQVMAAGPATTALTTETLSQTFGCEVQLSHDDGQFWTRVRPGTGWEFL